MHNSFYASGFLLHPSSQRILLQQYNSDSQVPEWTLFSTAGKGQETPNQAFHRLITEELGVPVKITDVYAVYDYSHKEKNVPHHIFYAVVDKVDEEETPLIENKTSWFYFRQIIKLTMKPQTKQDITVGQRVINLAIRELLPPETAEGI
jgi:ADP-ribose pyrophosphatase YjhB (NUDIX family)